MAIALCLFAHMNKSRCPAYMNCHPDTETCRHRERIYKLIDRQYNLVFSAQNCIVAVPPRVRSEILSKTSL